MQTITFAPLIMLSIMRCDGKSASLVTSPMKVASFDRMYPKRSGNQLSRLDRAVKRVECIVRSLVVRGAGVRRIFINSRPIRVEADTTV